MDTDESSIDEKDECTGNYVTTPYGFQSNGIYTHASKRCEIQALTFNNKTNEYIIVDSRGVTSWVKNIICNSTRRLLEFAGYKSSVIRDIIYCRTYNVYFALSKEYELKVFNLAFNEIYSRESDGNSISCLLYNEQSKELITVGRNHLRFWKYSLLSNGIKSQGLSLQREFPTPASSLVSNAIVDEEQQRIYLLCDYDVCCYDMEGYCLFHLKNTSSMYLSVCAYSSDANVMIIGSLNGQINIYSTSGGLVTTLLNHSRVVTSILIHPNDGNMFISSSMDGTIKLFSLHMLEELYSINVFSDGVYWMKLRSHNIFYCASHKSIQLFDLNYTFKFWGTVRCPVKSLKVTPKENKKTCHIIACNTDHSIRLYSKQTGQKKCTVLPPPEMSVLDEVLSVAYDRVGNIVYLLFKNIELWIYSVRTDPATRVAIWNIPEIIENYLNRGAPGDANISAETVVDIFGKSSFSLNRDDANIKCNCLSTVSQHTRFKKTTPNEEHMTIQHFSFLLCGMSNGSVYYLDPAIEGFVSSSFKAHQTCPVIEVDVFQYSYVTQISTLIKTIDGLLFKIWDAVDFMPLQEFAIPINYTTIASKVLFFAVGCSDGILHIKRHAKVNSQDSSLNFNDISTDLAYTKDHSGSILSVDILEEKEIVCSCGDDEYVRVWNCEKILLQEIKFEKSLCHSIFMDKDGTILLGFKSHLFLIPHDLLELPKNSSGESTDSWDNDSFVYEDPYVKHEHKRPPLQTATTLVNYLIPYPQLGMDSLWMFQNMLTNDIDENEDVDADVESIADSVHSSDIYADTEIYEDTEYSSDSRSSSKMFQFPQCEINSTSDESSEERPFVYQMEDVPVKSKVEKKQILTNNNDGKAMNAQLPTNNMLTLAEKIQDLQIKSSPIRQNVKEKEMSSTDKHQTQNKTKLKKKSKRRQTNSIRNGGKESLFKKDAMETTLSVPDAVPDDVPEVCLEKEPICDENELSNTNNHPHSASRRSSMSSSEKFPQSSLRKSSVSSSVQTESSSRVLKVPKISVQHTNVKSKNHHKSNALKQLAAISMGQFDRNLSASFHSVMGVLRGEKSSSDLERDVKNDQGDKIQSKNKRKQKTVEKSYNYKTKFSKSEFRNKEKTITKHKSNRTNKSSNSMQRYIVAKVNTPPALLPTDADGIKTSSENMNTSTKNSESRLTKTSKSKLTKITESKPNRTTESKPNRIIESTKTSKSKPTETTKSIEAITSSIRDVTITKKSSKPNFIPSTSKSIERNIESALQSPPHVNKSSMLNSSSNIKKRLVKEGSVQSDILSEEYLEHAMTGIDAESLSSLSSTTTSSNDVHKQDDLKEESSNTSFMLSIVRRLSKTNMFPNYDENMNRAISSVSNANIASTHTVDSTKALDEEINLQKISEYHETDKGISNYHVTTTPITVVRNNNKRETDKRNENSNQQDTKPNIKSMPSPHLDHQPKNSVADIVTSDSKSHVMKFIISAFAKKKPPPRTNNTLNKVERLSSDKKQHNNVPDLSLEYLDINQEPHEVDDGDYDDNYQFSNLDVPSHHKSSYSDEATFITPRNSIASACYGNPVTDVLVHKMDSASDLINVENKLIRSNSVLLQKLAKKRHYQAKQKFRCQSVQMRRNQSVSNEDSLPQQKRYHSADSLKERLRIKNFLIAQNDSQQQIEKFSTTTSRKPDMSRLEKMRNLEYKLSGQAHRFHLAKTAEQNDDNRVALHYLQAREDGFNKLPIKRSSNSIPSRFCHRIFEEVDKNQISSNVHVQKRYHLKNSEKIF